MDYRYSGFNTDTPPDPFNFDIKGPRKHISRLGLATAVYLFVAIGLILISEIVISLIFGEGAEAILTSDLYIWLSQIIAMYLIAFPVFYFITKGAPKKQRAKSKMDIEELVWLFFIAQLFGFVGSAISSVISTFFTLVFGTQPQDGVSELIMNTPVWIIIIVAVIIGPIFEELIFRKILIDSLSVYGERFAIVTTAVAFGLFHGNIEQLIYATSLGLVFGYVYSVTRNIKYSIGLHIVFNFFGTVPAMLISDSMELIASLPEQVLLNPEALMEYMPELMTVYGYSIVQMALLGFGIYFLVKAIKQKRFSPPCEVGVRIPRSEIAKTFVSPGVITFLAVSLLQIIINLIS